MTPHAKIYFKYFDLGEQSIVTCEACLKEGRADGEGFDLHHINGRGKDKNVIENIAMLCRRCHKIAHDELSKEEVQLIHNYYLTGKRKRFIK